MRVSNREKAVSDLSQRNWLLIIFKVEDGANDCYHFYYEEVGKMDHIDLAKYLWRLTRYDSITEEMMKLVLKQEEKIFSKDNIVIDRKKFIDLITV